MDSRIPLSNSKDTLNAINYIGTLEVLLIKINQQLSDLSGLNDLEIASEKGEFQIITYDTVPAKYKGHIIFQCEINTCSFKIGFIPKQARSYCISVNANQLESSNHLPCPENLSFEEISFKVKSFNKNMYSGCGSIDMLDNQRTIAFNVK